MGVAVLQCYSWGGRGAGNCSNCGAGLGDDGLGLSGFDVFSSALRHRLSVFVAPVWVRCSFALGSLQETNFERPFNDFSRSDVPLKGAFMKIVTDYFNTNYHVMAINS